MGTSDGTFLEKRYFECDDGYGLFVPLHKLSPYQSDQDDSYDRQIVQPSHGVTSSANVAGFKDAPSQKTRSKSMIAESSIDLPFTYKIGKHMSFKGIVRRNWTRKSTPSDTRRYGIRIVSLNIFAVSNLMSINSFYKFVCTKFACLLECKSSPKIQEMNINTGMVKLYTF